MKAQYITQLPGIPMCKYSFLAGLCLIPPSAHAGELLNTQAESVDIDEVLIARPKVGND